MTFDRLRKMGDALWQTTLRSKLARLERHSHGGRATYIGNNRILLKCVVSNKVLAFFLEADDKLLAPWFIISGRYETDVTNFLLREFRPDSHCIDVGANFGYFTCLMGLFCPDGKVIGIEADQSVYELVRDNIAINDLKCALAIHAAASDHSGETVLFRRDTRSGNTSIAQADRGFTDLMGEKPAEPFSVRAMRIDDLREELGGRLDLMKIDVEGAEPLAIRGAAETIAANPQLSIVMEWSPGQIQSAGFDLGEFLADLAARGLRPFDIVKKRRIALSYDELANLPYRAGVLLKRD